MVSKVAKLLEDRSQDKRRRIEAAALALFTTQGFHGTNNREIAKRAGVSTAAIYTHYPSKEALFTGLVEFKNQHFRASFHDVPEWFRRALGPVLANVSNQPGWCGQDPAFVLAAVYMYFVHYGLIEQHM